MCGISGLFATELESSQIRSKLEAMNHAQVHRGPDDGGIVVHGSLQAGLASRRLSIVDPAHGNQPMGNEDGSVFVVLNGEIYNHSELRSQLCKRGHQFKSHSDTEVIVHLYEESGPDCLKDLEGMFALGILDIVQKRLLVARDRAGMKPLYFCRNGADFAFASEVKALFAAGIIAPKPDPESIDIYLSLGYVPAPLSSFQGIEKLRPGSYLMVDETGLKQRSFWQFRYPPVRERRPAVDCSEVLENHIRRAVRSHLQADVPVGVFLSGGGDSSLIATLASQESSTPINTYSVIFPDDDAHDEQRYQRIMTKALGSNHHEIEFRSDDLVNHLSKATFHLEELCSAMPVTAHFKLALLASRQVKTVLSGEGADELLGGYSWNRVNFPYYLRRLPLRRLFALLGETTDRVRLRRISRVIAANDERAADAEWLRVFNPSEKRALLKPEYAGADSDLLSVLITPELLASCRDRLDRRLAHDFTGRLEGAILMAADKISMGESLEIRMPFLDNAVIDYALSLPSHMKIRKGREKYVLSLIGNRLLPPEIAGRRKKGLSQPGRRWLQEPLRSFVREFLLDHAETGPFNPVVLEKCLKRWLDPGVGRALPVVRLVYFQSWWNQFILGST